MSQKPAKASFVDKHPPGMPIDLRIQQAIDERARNRRLGCAAAHEIARYLSVSPERVGVTLDLLNFRIIRCQLGLFGYRPDPKPIHPASSMDADLQTALRQAAPNNRISCAACWRIAEIQGIPRMTVANACEALGFKIRPCQLGAF